MTPSFEFRDGQMVEVPDIHIVEDTVLTDDINRTLIIESGATATTTGKISGTITLREGSLVARGNVSGTVDVGEGCSAIFHSQMSGTLGVDRGGHVRLLPGAVATGTMRVDGTLVNEGVRGVKSSGSGSIEDRGAGRVRQPDEILPDGTLIYRN